MIEMGDHQTLLDQGGLYYRLYSLGFEQAAVAANGDAASAQESATAGSS
jgi:hypothetical protein